MPQMTGGVLFEHGHRLVATFVGMLTVGLTIWLALAEQRTWMKKLGWIALGAVIVQGLLGGLTVKLLLPPVVSVSHACLAQLFFSTTVAIAIFTSRSWQDGPELVQDYGTPSLRSLAILLPTLLLAQVALGAAFRHGAMTVMAHVIGAMVVAPAVLIVCAFVLHQFPEHRALHRAATVLLWITLAQVMLGLGAYMVRSNVDRSPLAMVIVTVAHVATGALTLASSIGLAIQVRRNVTEQVRQAVTA
jgi:cytochrome c oxidase assembly protein subunit 15